MLVVLFNVMCKTGEKDLPRFRQTNGKNYIVKQACDFTKFLKTQQFVMLKRLKTIPVLFLNKNDARETMYAVYRQLLETDVKCLTLRLLSSDSSIIGFIYRICSCLDAIFFHHQLFQSCRYSVQSLEYIPQFYPVQWILSLQRFLTSDMPML